LKYGRLSHDLIFKLLLESEPKKYNLSKLAKSMAVYVSQRAIKECKTLGNESINASTGLVWRFSEENVKQDSL